MRPRKPTPFIVINVVSGDLECHHCGGYYNFNSALPASLSISRGILDGFIKDHRLCKEAEAGRELKKQCQDGYAKWIKEHGVKDAVHQNEFSSK